MSVSKDEVLKIARLAELHVDEVALPAIVEQMSRILDYVAQIAEVAASETAPPFVPGPDASPFREDVVQPALLARRPAEMAPSFRDGFFLVPRLDAFEAGDEHRGEDE